MLRSKRIEGTYISHVISLLSKNVWILFFFLQSSHDFFSLRIWNFTSKEYVVGLMVPSSFTCWDFAPLTARTSVAMCKIHFTGSENKIIWRSINFCWTLSWVQGWEEAKWNGLSGLWCVHHLFYLLHRREADSFLLVASSVCPLPSPLKWSMKLSWGLWSSDCCRLVSFTGNFLFSWSDSSCQWWIYYKKITAPLVISRTDLLIMLRCFLSSPCRLLLCDLFSFLLHKTSVKILVRRSCITDDALVGLYFRLPDFLLIWNWVLSELSYFLTAASSGLWETLPAGAGWSICAEREGKEESRDGGMGWGDVMNTVSKVRAGWERGWEKGNRG